MKYINCCILLACLINYCVVIVWLQSLQPHVPTPAAAAAPLWQSVPEKIHILLFVCPHAQFMFLLWQTQKLVCQPPPPFCNNPCLSKLSLQSYSLPAGRVLFLALSACTELEAPKVAVSSLLCCCVVRQPGAMALCRTPCPAWLHTGGRHCCGAPGSHTSGKKRPCVHGQQGPAFYLTLLLKWLLHHYEGIHN